MSGALIVLLIALAAIFIAWKIFVGIIRTGALAVILIVAAIIVFGVM